MGSAFDARPDLLEAFPADELRFVDELVDGLLPASERLAGVSNEGAAVEPRATYDLEPIRVPSLVVHTRDDTLNPFAIGERIAQRIRRARFLMLDQGGHFLLGHHTTLRIEIHRFLQEKEDRPSSSPDLNQE